MKQFFKSLLFNFKTLFNGKSSKHQKWLFYGTLAFGLIANLLFGSLFTIILMLALALLMEFTYSYIPVKYVFWKGIQFGVPNYVEFKKSYKEYMMKPQNEFESGNFAYVCYSIIIFIIINLIF